MVDIEIEQELKNYLVAQGRVSFNESIQSIPLTGGVSNRTVLLKRETGEEWVLKQALNKLRVKADWFSDPARIEKEALGIRWLSTLTPHGTIPRYIFLDNTEHILAMEAIPQPHANWKHVLLSGGVDQNHMVQFGRILGQIHRGSHLQRATLEPIFEDRQFFETLRLEPFYQYTATQNPDIGGFLMNLIVATRENIHTLVHGDYSPKNILIYNNQLILLDHEVIHFGDPAFDIGFSLAHLLSKAHHLQTQRDALCEASLLYWTTYLQTLGTVPWLDVLEQRAVQQTLGCLLARVDGRSPLEYLTQSERVEQRRITKQLMGSVPQTIPDLINIFREELSQDAYH